MKLGYKIKRLKSLLLDLLFIYRNVEELKILTGELLVQKQQVGPPPKKLADVEFKVFSQWGDDGIIQYLVNNLEIDNKVFVEFGVEDYYESNTRYLLMRNNWKGLIIDGSPKYIKAVRESDLYWKYELTAKAAFITAENINELIGTEGIAGEIGLLHVDIDGNDLWVWKAITVVNPVIVIVEYNSVFGSERAITVPYDPAFVRGQKHYSQLYYGASVSALCNLAAEKGYSFIGCTSSGNNAYFIRNDRLKLFPALTPQQGYVASRFRESRDVAGKLTYVSGSKRLELIRGLPVIEYPSGAQQTI
jgi:hypothetical protein